MTIDTHSIVRQAQVAGVRFHLSDDGAVRIAATPETLKAWASILREHRDEIRQLLMEPESSRVRQKTQSPPTPPNGESVADCGGVCAVDHLKGAAVLFVAEAAAGDIRCWIVADQADADRLRRSGIEADDVVVDRQEVRELVAIADPVIVSEILNFKRQLPNGRLHREGLRR